LSAQAFENGASASAKEPVLDSTTVPSAANWVVLYAIGTAAWRAEGEPRWREFMPGEVLPPGCEIETGADGEVTLVAGGDQLIVSPYTRLIVPQVAADQDRRLRHERGRIRVHIESRGGRKVRVDTPLLSLGIKGTTFEVEVGADEDSVVVLDGEVEVTTPDQPDAVDLGAGQGLRQSAVPGSPATRFTVPAHEIPSLSASGATPDPFQPHPLQLRDGAVEGAVPGDRPGSPESLRESAQARSPSGNSDQRSSSSSPERGSFGWVDEWASSWAWIAIAGVAFVVVTIPLLALIQKLREQRPGRSQAQGRRRRELVRG
jgi:hypothetical protein